MFLGYQEGQDGYNVTTALANNVLIKNNYMKGFYNLIQNEPLYNAGDGQRCIVHKSFNSLSADEVIIQGNWIILDICLHDDSIHFGIVVQSNRFDIIDNYVYINHGIGLGLSYNGNAPGTYIEEANIIDSVRGT